MSVNNHNQNNSPGINNNSGHVKATPRLPPRSNVLEGFASGNQDDILTFETAPRSNEKITEPQAVINANGAESNLSYHFPPNSNTRTSNQPYYTGSEVDPIKVNTSTTQYNERPEANPYFLFFGKFSSTLVQNMKPNLVGHYDVSGGTVNQQPSNIYNIPDYPKDYTMFKSSMTSYNTGNNDPLNEQNIMDEFTTDKIIYDASSCPVNWRMFGPIQRQVIDWSNNGITGGGGGSGGTGTDLSFNNFFFKQPEMPLDCSCIFVSSSITGGNDKLSIFWDKPFNRKAGTSYSQQGTRYFYKDGTNPVENWLPHFSEIVLDISGGPNNRTFSKDAFGNFSVDNAYGLFSANNTKVDFEATTNPSSGGSVSVSGGPGYGTSGITTTIVDNIPSSSPIIGGNYNTGDIGLGSTYDIAVYYRNETKINTSVPANDLKYNNHNLCLFRNIIFGIPGLVAEPDSIEFWNNGSLQSGGRIYLGGIGPDFKDEKGNPIAGEGLNLPWSNTSLIKVGYDCSLNMISNIGATKVQAGESDGAGGFYGINNYIPNKAVNNFDVSYNLLSNGVPDTMNNTKQNWPNGTGTGGTGANTGPVSLNDDYIKLIDIQSGVPASSARDHPEYKYTVTEYNVTNDTLDKTTGLVVPNSHPTYSASAPFTYIVPINTRAYCNTMGDIRYNDMMVSVSENPTTDSKTFLDFYNRSGPSSNPTDTPFAKPAGWNGTYKNYFKARSRRGVTSLPTTNDNFGDVVFIELTNNRLVLKSVDSSSGVPRIFKQLANYGEPKPPPIVSQLSNDLVNSDAYLGVLSSQTINYLSRIQLLAEYGDGTWTDVTNWKNSTGGGASADPTPFQCDILGYSNTSPAQLNTSAQTKLKSNQGHYYTYSLSAPFDIAKNDGETIYSNTRGYYLGFDISGIEIELDPGSGNQSGPPFEDSSSRNYDQYRIRLMHAAEKRGSGNEVEEKELIFRLGVKPGPSDNIDISENSISITNHKSSGLTFTKFFGVNRLPTATTGNSSAFGTGLELIINFTLDDINENWMPHTDFTGPDDKIAEAHFVIDPVTNNISIDEFIFKWNDINGKSSTPIGTSSESFESFIEINEGVDAIAGNSPTAPYSRAITEATPVRNLFGLHDNKIYYSNNVTFRGDDLSFDSTDYSNAQNYTLLASSTAIEDGQDKFKFGSSNEELFWDYTWPKISNSNTGKLPTTFNEGNKFKYLMELAALRQTNSVWDSGSSGQSFDLPSLTGNDTASGSAYTTKYNHNIDINSNTNYNNQCMWANNYFVGASGVTSSNNPYVDYNIYYEQTLDYSSLATAGYSYSRSFSGTALATGITGGQGSPKTFTFSNIKWILLETNVTIPQQSGKSFDIEVFGDATGINGTSTTNVLKLGTHYLLFYCEYKPNAYTVDGTSNCDYSTWLDALSKDIGTGSGGIKSIQTSNNGLLNGAHKGGGDTKPAIVDLQKSAERKYLLFGVPEDVKIYKIKLT